MQEPNTEVEKVNGIWKGTPISIKKKWSTHEFTADEIAKLFNDEIIEFEAVSKSGNTYIAKGKLEEQEYEGNTFIGFKLIVDNDETERFTGIWNNKNVKVKRIWSGHRFTDEEVQKLLNDEVITFEHISKYGNKYIAKGKLAEQSFNGNKYVGFKLFIDEE